MLFPQELVVSQEACLYDLKQFIRSGQAWNTGNSENYGKAGQSMMRCGLHICRKGGQTKVLLNLAA
jgi:hypothetical protein